MEQDEPPPPLNTSRPGNYNHSAVFKYNPNGELLANNVLENTGYKNILDIDFDNDNNMYCTSATGTGFYLYKEDSLVMYESSSGKIEGFIMVFDSMLNYKRYIIPTKSIGNYDWSYINEIKILEDGSMLLAGFSEASSMQIGNKTLYNELDYFAYLAHVRETELGIELVEPNTTSFTLYPNPTSGMVTIELNSNNNIKTAEIYNLQGQKVKEISFEEFSRNATNSYTLNLSTLPKGIYFVKIGEESRKIILI